MNMFSVFFKGGFMMIPIVLASILGLAIFFERYSILKTNKKASLSSMKYIRNFLDQKKIKEAYQFCISNPCSITNILKNALKNHQKSYQFIKDSIESTGKLEVARLEQNLNILYTIATVSPLMGFLGTVIGMLKAFQKIAALGSGVNASILAGGIWEALITTIAGLVVGIPLLIAYNYLVAKIDHFVLGLEENSIELIDLIEDYRN